MYLFCDILNNSSAGKAYKQQELAGHFLGQNAHLEGQNA